jgi:hypothetical protein
MKNGKAILILGKISTNVGVWSIGPDGNLLKQLLESLKRYARHTLVLSSQGLPFRGLRRRVKQFERRYRPAPTGLRGDRYAVHARARHAPDVFRHGRSMAHLRITFCARLKRQGAAS